VSDLNSSPISWVAVRWAISTLLVFYNKPDPVEYVRITNDQLKERDGAYQIRVTNELEEATLCGSVPTDRSGSPSDVDIYPNEGLTDQPRPFRLFVTRDARPASRRH
jgi:hypothetical protein